ncbi:hypothetical protein AC578_4275 [Pseudocercospora eumusae]|uniref:Uncharacterized protein n=1 Tax=Pseudocercospora eumusae TaxID=321146 RepID=A0A139HAU1_9PEZI|nr:hypothetical protein AC578_4275 [Pseudocercospora eumusae]
MPSAGDERFLFYKRALGFRNASRSTRTLKRDLRDFFHDIDHVLIDLDGSDPSWVRNDEDLADRIHTVISRHAPGIWSNDQAQRNMILVRAGGYLEYADDLYWENQDHRILIGADMFEMVVEYALDETRKGRSWRHAS